MTKAEIALTILVAIAVFALCSGATQSLIVGGL